MFKKLFVIAALASSMAMISCGGNTESKDLAFDKTIAGDKSADVFYSEIIEFSDVPANYSYEYVSKSETGRASDDQNWTIEISYVVKNDGAKGAPVDVIINKLKDYPLTADVLNAKGEEVSGQKDFQMTDENIKALAETLIQGKGTEGKLVFTHQTSNKNDYKKWFNEESASVRVSGKAMGKDSAKSSGSKAVSGEVDEPRSASPGAYDDPRSVSPGAYDDMSMGANPAGEPDAY